MLIANKELNYIDLKLIDSKVVEIRQQDGYDWIIHESDVYNIGKTSDNPEDNPFLKSKLKYNLDKLIGPVLIQIGDGGVYVGAILIPKPGNHKDGDIIVFKVGNIDKELNSMTN